MSAHLLRVELFESETIAERGTRKQAWRIRQGDAWVRAEEVADAVIEVLEAGPGTIWERRIELMLEAGTLLMRIDSRPEPRHRRDALSYLEREVRLPKRHTLRRHYRVSPRGELLPTED